MEHENRKESIKIAVENVVDITMQSLKTSPQVLNNAAPESKRRTNKKLKHHYLALSSKVHKKPKNKEL